MIAVLKGSGRDGSSDNVLVDPLVDAATEHAAAPVGDEVVTLGAARWQIHPHDDGVGAA